MMGADTIAGTADVVRTGRGFPILRVSPSPSFTASGLSIVTSVLSSTRPTPPSPPARYMPPRIGPGSSENRTYGRAPPECLDGAFCELRLNGVLRSWYAGCRIAPLAGHPMVGLRLLGSSRSTTLYVARAHRDAPVHMRVSPSGH
jgi:hypothetical protein